MLTRPGMQVLEWGDALDGAADDGIKEKAQRSSLGKHLGLVFDSLEAVHPDALIVLKFYSLLEPETIPLFEAWLRPDRSAGFAADIGAAPKQSSRRFIGCLSALNCFKKLPDNPPADKDEPTWHPADDLIHIFQDEVRRERAIAKLCDLSLVHRVRNANRVLWMHDLTRKSVRASIPQDAIRKWTTAGIEVVYHMMPEEDGTVEEHVWVDKCLLAAMALIREAPARGLEVREYACLLALCALSNLHHNAWPLSRKQFEQSKPLYEKYLGQDHKRTILLLHKLALATRHDGDMSRAEAYCRQALKLYEQKLGPTDSKTLNVLNDLASTIERAGRLKEAESMFRKLYEQEEKASGMQGPRTMAAAHNLALCLHNQGRLREAESIYREAIKASEIHLGRDDPGTLKTLSNYAVTLDHDGKFDEAQKTYNLIRNSFIQVMGLDHHLTLRLRGNMAGVLRQQGKFDQAESVMRDCLDTVEQTFGPESFETITDLYEMGEIWQAKGEVERARNAFEKTMSHLSGDMLDHPVVFRFIDSWGAAEREMGHLDVAREKSLDAYNRFERLLGWDDPYTLMAANDHAEVLHAEGKHNEAQDLLARCLDSFAQLLGKEHPHYAMVLNNLGRVAWARKTEDPMPYFVKAHKVLTNRLGEGHYCTATVSVNIARSLFYAGNTTDALAALETSHDVLVAAVGKIHPLSSACDTTAGLILASRGDQPSLTEAERRFSSYRKVSEEMGNTKNADYYLNVCLLLLVRKLLQYSDSDLKQLRNILNSPDAGRVAPWDIPGLGKRPVAQLASMDPNKFSFQGYLPLAVGETIRLRWGRKTCWREAEIAKLQD
ncbi:uncharacterized protein PODANS_5_7560 [Podospora anserina S mat+]|uniref:Podospora anserina S mat+ genomic DNA chromosome 5, supercontig 8 n=1 Tax=Podospora anserina (strain S / ATCC MYA-4624 / DSM 980 / FGSC 10383) TaxID=515849 RepID=B2AMC9_PODAN|nr:uncharacterized protein PODANS_5_7560 [Podospora anserina S mat+]CAP65189.1 unnamed protein product [Podospora anserina S mat+]CDP29722.1 Putative protein of unknown function [Podospora anserina S mat+]